jgi:hypothetical protein
MPYMYVWNTTPVQTSQTLTGLTAGIYKVTVTDSHGCTAKSSVALTQPGLLVTTMIVLSPVSCYQGSNGVLKAGVTGGTVPYAYVWNTIPVQTTQTISGLTAGSYSVAVTDAHGCSSSASIFLTEPIQFTERTGLPFTGVGASSADWGDYDNDGDLDLLLTGSTLASRISRIYRNNGDKTFTLQSAITLTGVHNGSVDWGDYNNDGFLDILLTGSTGITMVTKVYKNNGDNTFTEQTGMGLPGVGYSAVAWGDYNNDGNLDILLTGLDGGSLLSRIYKNNGDNTFTGQSGISLTAVSGGAVGWCDYDNDGFLDILLTGNTGTTQVSKIYRNNGNNTFTEQTSISLSGVANGSVAWGDYNNDGNPDILLTGMAGSTPISKIYKNNGNNTFTEQAGIVLPGISISSAVWGDYNNDGSLDIFMTGTIDGINCISKVYKNNNDNTFSELTGISFTGTYYSSAVWGDYDNDNDLDILVSGATPTGPVAKLYDDNNCIMNTPPSPPGYLDPIVVNGYDVIFNHWDPGTDAQTPESGLTYNIYAGTSPGGIQEISPMARLSDGYRRVVQRGNTGQVSFFILNDLTPGTYYWGAQAIDNSYAGSVFATGPAITVPPLTVTADPVPTCIGMNDGAVGIVVKYGATPYTYQWNNGATSQNISNLSPGYYEVTVTDQDGYTATASGTVITVNVTNCVNTVQNRTIPSGQTDCFEAGHTLYIAGGGTTFIVQNGGSVTLIAGRSIHLLEGTNAQTGGYLHAYITYTNQFCSTVSPIVTNPTLGGGETNLGISTPEEDGFSVHIYPNPTSDRFTLVVETLDKISHADVNIYNMRGEEYQKNVLQEELTGEYSLEGAPPGIYLIRIVAGDHNAIIKVVKQ